MKQLIIASWCLLLSVGCATTKSVLQHYDPPYLHSTHETPDKGISLDDSVTDCEVVIDAARVAITKKDDEIKEINEELKLITDDRNKTLKELTDAQNKLDDIWHNPYFLIGIGLLGGIVIMR